MYNMLYMKQDIFSSEHDQREVDLAGTVTVGPKGQVVIPAEIRDKMNIGPSSKLIALYFKKKNLIGFVTHDQVQKHIDQMGASIIDARSILEK